MLVTGGQLDWMILEVFSNLGDSILWFYSVLFYVQRGYSNDWSCGRHLRSVPISGEPVWHLKRVIGHFFAFTARFAIFQASEAAWNSVFNWVPQFGALIIYHSFCTVTGFWISPTEGQNTHLAGLLHSLSEKIDLMSSSFLNCYYFYNPQVNI